MCGVLSCLQCSCCSIAFLARFVQHARAHYAAPRDTGDDLRLSQETQGTAGVLHNLCLCAGTSPSILLAPLCKAPDQELRALHQARLNTSVAPKCGHLMPTGRFCHDGTHTHRDKDRDTDRQARTRRRTQAETCRRRASPWPRAWPRTRPGLCRRQPRPRGRRRIFDVGRTWHGFEKGGGLAEVEFRQDRHACGDFEAPAAERGLISAKCAWLKLRQLRLCWSRIWPSWGQYRLTLGRRSPTVAWNLTMRNDRQNGDNDTILLATLKNAVTYCARDCQCSAFAVVRVRLSPATGSTNSGLASTQRRPMLSSSRQVPCLFNRP